MKGFIEITHKSCGARRLINIRHIEEVIENADGACTIYMAFNVPNAIEQDYIDTDKSFDEIVELIKEAECKVCGERTSKVIAQLQDKIADLQCDYDLYKVAAKDVLEHAKAEVAREIFGEIDDVVARRKVGYINNKRMVELFAELKEKYTEGESK